MEMKKNLPNACPSCNAQLHVAALYCPTCETRIEGDYRLPTLLLLPTDDQRFVLDFILCSGSLKEMASRLGLSYPTVRNRLDDIINQLKSYEQ